MNVALTIATSDSGGGAGIQADIKAMQANGVFAASVLVAVTAQNTREVADVFAFPPAIIESQIDAVADDLAIGAAKTGMLFSSEIIEAVARKIKEWELAPLVVDPVMISKSGYTLLQDDAIATLKERLLPLATLATPNAHEAGRLAELEVNTVEDAKEAARRIRAMGPQAVLVKGGHLEGAAEAVDVLYDGEAFETFTAERIQTPHTHGTGCTYASAIAANLAKGYGLAEAIGRAKRYVTEAIRHGLALGGGHGPTHHFYFLDGMDVFPVEDQAADPASSAGQAVRRS